MKVKYCLIRRLTEETGWCGEHSFDGGGRKGPSRDDVPLK